MNKILFLTLLTLTGCTSYPRQSDAYLTCSGAQYEKIWQRAQTWLATNGAYRIQLANDSIIQTYGPQEYVVNSVAYTITKEPQINGSTRIFIRGSCFDSGLGCYFDPTPATNSLIAALSQIQ